MKNTPSVFSGNSGLGYFTLSRRTMATPLDEWVRTHHDGNVVDASAALGVSLETLCGVLSTAYIIDGSLYLPRR